ncbi:MAG TPA: hypothetical protein VHC22_07275 [Pirellulales bacterium]|nr:hypothetical protein [Pirellulales bacterium]
MPIEQVYCTHCTYGTSALEQREGELAERVLGYSARAGSLDRNELRNDYRAIERFLYYYLPSDTPPEEKQRLDAKTAPRRLFFCPSMGKLQMVGQVAYRQYDTAGRLGSYFAHVLFGDRSSNAWSAADCLRLWNAPWVQEDSLEHPYKLSSLERMDGLWSGRPPAISDDALLHFLRSPPGTTDDESVIPGRWQSAPVSRRVDLLAGALEGLLALGPQRRENVLLVVEPSVAALVFYGVVRLLPKSFSDGLSFSTYEPNAERLPVTLAATTFFDPFTNDVRSDLYRRRGLVLNTFQDRVSDGGVPTGKYAHFIIERLLEEGWPTVDRLMAAFEAAGAKRPEDLELLSSTHGLAAQILSATPPADDTWRSSQVAVRYLSHELQFQLATAPAGWPQLHRVVGTPNHLTVLELVASNHIRPEVQRPAQFLLKKFAPEKIADLVNSPLVGNAAKVEALVAYVTAHGRLPDGCQFFAGDGPRPATRSPAESPLLAEVLGRLPEPVLRRVCDLIEEGQRLAFFGTLLAAMGRPAWPAVKSVLLEMITGFSNAMLLDALVVYREQIVAACATPEPALAGRLGRLLYDLPDHPRSFEKWLQILVEWKAAFFLPDLAERRLGEWNKFRSCLLSFREQEDAVATGGLDRLKQRWRSAPSYDYKSLAEALFRAMPRRSSDLDELAEVAASGRLTVPEFKRRLELAARQAGVPWGFNDAGASASANGETSGGASTGGPGDEVARSRRQREDQAAMARMFRQLEERMLVYGDDAVGTRRLAALQQIGQVLIGRPNFLGNGKRLIETFFGSNGIWPSHALIASSKKIGGYKTRSKKREWTPFLAVGALAAVLVPIVGFLALRGGSGSVSRASKPADVPPEAVTQTKPPVKSNDVPSQEPDPTQEDRASAAGPESDRSAKATPDEEASGADSDDGQPASVSDTSPASPGKEEVSSTDSPAATPPPGGDSAAADKMVPMPDEPSKDDNGAADEESDHSGVPSDGRIVHELHSLPTLGARFLDRVTLKKWPVDAGQINLTLKGLAVANERLAGKCKLTADRRSDGLAIAMDSSGGRDGAPNTLAMLLIHGVELSFQWAESSHSLQSAEEARRQLRRCVVEATTATDTAYLALATPIRREPVPFINGVAKLPLRSAEFQADSTDDLLLGQGYVELNDGSKIAFGTADHVADTASLTGLPEDMARSEAQITLVGRAKNSLDRELRLVEGDVTLPDDLKPLSEDERKVLQVLKDCLPKLNSTIGKLRSWEQQAIVTKIETNVQALATALGVPAPQRAGSMPPPDPKKYLQDVRAKVVEPAEQRRDDLVKRQGEVDAFKQAPHKQFKALSSQVAKVTATLYRRVDTDTFVPCLVLGDPAQVAASQKHDDEDD